MCVCVWGGHSTSAHSKTSVSITNTSNVVSYITSPFKTMTYLGERLTSDGAVTWSFLQHFLSSAGLELSGWDSRHSSTSLSLTNMMFPSKRSVILLLFLTRPKSASMLTIIVPSVWNQTSTLVHPFLSDGTKSHDRMINLVGRSLDNTWQTEPTPVDIRVENMI